MGRKQIRGKDEREMTVKERIRTVRLAEKLGQNGRLGEDLGLTYVMSTVGEAKSRTETADEECEAGKHA